MLQLVGGLKAKVYLDKTDDLSFKNLCKKFWLRLKSSIAKSESQIYLYDIEAHLAHQKHSSITSLKGKGFNHRFSSRGNKFTAGNNAA